MLEALLNRPQVEGFVGTWSALKRAREVEPTDPFDEFIDAMRRAWPDAMAARRVRWPMILKVGRRL